MAHAHSCYWWRSQKISVILSLMLLNTKRENRLRHQYLLTTVTVVIRNGAPVAHDVSKLAKSHKMARIHQEALLEGHHLVSHKMGQTHVC